MIRFDVPRKLSGLLQTERLCLRCTRPADGVGFSTVLTVNDLGQRDERGEGGVLCPPCARVVQQALSPVALVR